MLPPNLQAQPKAFPFNLSEGPEDSNEGQSLESNVLPKIEELRLQSVCFVQKLVTLVTLQGLSSLLQFSDNTLLKEIKVKYVSFPMFFLFSIYILFFMLLNSY